MHAKSGQSSISLSFQTKYLKIKQNIKNNGLMKFNRLTYSRFGELFSRYIPEIKKYIPILSRYILKIRAVHLLIQNVFDVTNLRNFQSS